MLVSWIPWLRMKAMETLRLEIICSFILGVRDTLWEENFPEKEDDEFSKLKGRDVDVCEMNREEVQNVC